MKILVLVIVYIIMLHIALYSIHLLQAYLVNVDLILNVISHLLLTIEFQKHMVLNSYLLILQIMHLLIRKILFLMPQRKEEPYSLGEILTFCKQQNISFSYKDEFIDE